MDVDLIKNILNLIKDIKRQIGDDNPVAQYVATAVREKMVRDNLNRFMERDITE
jgi:hypothetical protein